MKISPFSLRKVSTVSLLALLAMSSTSSATTPTEDCEEARWLINNSSWGTLSYVEDDGNLKSLVASIAELDGRIFFYLGQNDQVPSSFFKASLTVSEAQVDPSQFAGARCGIHGNLDPEDPRCAKLSISGVLSSFDKEDDDESRQLKIALDTLFAAHPEMMNWSEEEEFVPYEMKINEDDGLWLLSDYGGASILKASDYFDAKPVRHSADLAAEEEEEELIEEDMENPPEASGDSGDGPEPPASGDSADDSAESTSSDGPEPPTSSDSADEDPVVREVKHPGFGNGSHHRKLSGSRSHKQGHHHSDHEGHHRPHEEEGDAKHHLHHDEDRGSDSRKHEHHHHDEEHDHGDEDHHHHQKDDEDHHKHHHDHDHEGEDHHHQHHKDDEDHHHHHEGEDHHHQHHRDHDGPPDGDWHKHHRNWWKKHHNDPNGHKLHPHPDFGDDAVAHARWLVSRSFWGTISTISSTNQDQAFGNIRSIVDGACLFSSTGQPVFYLPTPDPSSIDIEKNNQISLSFTEAALAEQVQDGSPCGGETADPTCAKITLSGNAVPLDDDDDEAIKKTEKYFKIRHPRASWLANGGAHTGGTYFTIDVKSIAFVRDFDGVIELDVEDYLAHKLDPKMFQEERKDENDRDEDENDEEYGSLKKLTGLLHLRHGSCLFSAMEIALVVSFILTFTGALWSERNRMWRRDAVYAKAVCVDDDAHTLGEFDDEEMMARK